MFLSELHHEHRFQFHDQLVQDYRENVHTRYRTLLDVSVCSIAKLALLFVTVLLSAICAIRLLDISWPVCGFTEDFKVPL